MPQEIPQLILHENKHDGECKGLFFRGYSSMFYDSINCRVERREGIRLLKRRSCPGCYQCGFLKDDLQEFVAGGNIEFPEIKNGALYGVRITNRSIDWESGIVDDWDLEIFKIEGE